MVAARFFVDSRRAAHFAHHDDQGFVKHPALIEVGDQRAEGAIDVGYQVGAETWKAVVVHVPARRIDANKTATRFDHAASQQSTLANLSVPVCLAAGRWFALNVECSFCFRGGDQAVGLFVVGGHHLGGTLVAVGSESEPVASNEEFISFAEAVLEVVERDGPDGVGGLEEARIELVGILGENIVVHGAARFDVDGDDVVTAYIHPPAQKIGVLVRATSSLEFARLLAMHIAFANPQYIERDAVPADNVLAERAIYEKLPEVMEKPENIHSKIVEGMLNKRFYSELVLVDQTWIHDDSKTVGQALDQEGAQVREFARYALE